MIHNEENNDEIGNNHIATSTHNPIREDAFDISDEGKNHKNKKRCRKHFTYSWYGLNRR